MVVFAGRLFVFLFLMFSPFAGRAAEENRGFEAVSTAVNAEFVRPEFCLTFNKPIKPNSRAAIAAALRLEKGGAKVKVLPQDLSLTAVDVCVQGLEHGRHYRIGLKNLESKDGQTLAKPVNLSFDVPDRKPSLSFVSSGWPERLPGYAPGEGKESFLIKSVNVAAARLALYRFSGREVLPEAWEQAGSINLAPSESLYVAAQKGETVWQTELKFSGAVNAEQHVEAPLPSRDVLKPGLYFLAAVPVSSGTAGPALTAGRWFLISDMTLSVFSSAGGLSVFASCPGKGRVAENVALQVVAMNGAVLAEGKTGKDGAAFFPLAAMPSQDKPAYVTALAPSGAPGIVEVEGGSNGFSQVADGSATLVPDRSVYLPGSTAVITLYMKDGKGAPAKTPDGFLKLVQPNQSFYAEKAVPSGQTGAVYINFPLPAVTEAGEWGLLWQRPDGVVLARASLRIVSEGVWPDLQLTAGQDVVDPGGKAVFTVKASGKDKRPLAWRRGFLEAKAARPSFAGWDGYLFGPELSEKDEPLARTVFMTQEQGTAKTGFVFPAQDKTIPFQGVEIEAGIAGVAGTVKTVLPVAGSQGWIGLRPVHGEDHFPENSEALFDIVAVDAQGRSRDVKDLYYQIYEEGRSFQWIQAGGRWDYKPLPQHRRAGGGRVAVKASGKNRIAWPMTAGHYMLEVTTDEGVVLAQQRFQAGGRLPSLSGRRDNRLTFAKPPIPHHKSEGLSIVLKTAEPAMAAVILENGDVRQSVHRSLVAGDNTISFSSFAEAGRTLRVRAAAAFPDGRLSLAAQDVRFVSEEEGGGLKIETPAQIAAGEKTAVSITLKASGLDKEAVASALVTPSGPGDASGMTSVPVSSAGAGKTGKISLPFEAPDFSGKLNVTVSAWDGRRLLTKELSIDVRKDFTMTGDVPSLLLAGDRAAFALRMENNDAAEGTYAYEVTVPPGFEVKGNAKGKAGLRKGKSLIVPLEIVAGPYGQGVVRIDVKGPKNAAFSRQWPVSVLPGNRSLPAFVSKALDPGQTLSLPLSRIEGAFPEVLLAGSFPVHELPGQWQALIAAEPLTLQELAHWLEAARYWADPVKILDIPGSGALHRLAASRIKLLQEHQNADGGFSLWPSGPSSDLASTASVLMALQAEAPLASEQAIRWIQRRLDNTWFEESERPARATAFLALSKAGKADLSALRYFADTSRDKDLSALAMAELALAFALNKDENAARNWLALAWEASAASHKPGSAEKWSFLYRVAQNEFSDIRSVIRENEREPAAKDGLPSGSATDALRMKGALAKRIGSWRIVIDGKDTKTNGVRRLKIVEGAKNISLSNPMDTKLYVALPSPEKKEWGSSTALTIDRQLFALDGRRIEPDEVLEQNRVYVLTVQGRGKLDEASRQMPFLAAVPSGTGLRTVAVSGAGGDAVFKEAFPWLSPPLTAAEGAFFYGEGAGFVFQATGDWRFACLVRAEERGVFTLPSASVHDLSGTKRESASNPLRVTIR